MIALHHATAALAEQNTQEFGPNAGSNVLVLALIPPNLGLHFYSNSGFIFAEQEQFPLVTTTQFFFFRNSIFSAAGFQKCESKLAFISHSKHIPL